MRLGPCLTKLVATLGPASADVDTMVRMIDEGVRVFRLNFSHGSADDHAAMLRQAREAEQQVGTPIAVFGDLPGPKIRLGQVPKPGIDLAQGDELRLMAAPSPSSEAGDVRAALTVTMPEVLEDLRPGQRVLIDDGLVRGLIDRVDERGVHVAITAGGRISTGKGVNLPDTELTLPSLTSRDEDYARWAVQHGLDYLALSFVRRSEDVAALRDLLASQGASLPIIAKIEKPQAVHDLERIVEAADVLMVARGDLGVEMDLADVPVVQRQIVATAHARGRPVIIATQMLQSMVDNSWPTRAEVSDVANAVFGGADALMLSGETAVGAHPVRAVHIMKEVSARAEPHRERVRPDRQRGEAELREPYRAAALAQGVHAIVAELDIRLIVCHSRHGGTAQYLSRTQPGCPIIAGSADCAALRRSALWFGVNGVLIRQPDSVESFIEGMDRLLRERNWVDEGEPVVVVSGEPINIAGVTNRLSIHYVGDPCRPGADFQI